ncbi:hypothetical protein MJH12_14830, partial [bacterium]|nr:hypothetical protein [bacterium]
MKPFTKRLNKIQIQLQKHLQSGASVQFESSLQQSLDFLSSKESHSQIQEDPYWPKWHGPWWHVLALVEIGQEKLIPQEMISALKRSVEKNTLDFFPLLEKEIPDGIDPYRNIICHCALGSYLKILLLTEENFCLPQWIKDWFVKYQLQDGGYNCDDESYHKIPAKSSLVSTLPMLESLLILLRDTESFHDEEKLQMTQVLDQGAHYFLKRNLLCKSSDQNQVINEDWLKLTFPRFYELDALRILSFLQKWSQFRQTPLKIEPIKMVLEHLCQRVEKEGFLSAGFHMTRVDDQSLFLQSDQSWKFSESSRFPLLESLENPLIGAHFLNKEF